MNKKLDINTVLKTHPEMQVIDAGYDYETMYDDGFRFDYNSGFSPVEQALIWKISINRIRRNDE